MSQFREREQLYREKRELQVLTSLLGLLLLGLITLVIAILTETNYPITSKILRELGLVITPPAVLALLYERFAERDHARETANRIADFLETQLEHRLGGQIENSDIVAVYPARHAIDFYKYYSQATKQIDILTTNLQSMENYVGLLIDLAKKGVKIRILTLHPSNEFINRRFTELGFKEARSFAEEMIVSIKHFCRDKEQRLTEEQRDNFQIRLYKNPPSMMLFRRDYNIIVSFILQQGRSRDQLHMEFNCFPQSGKQRLSTAFIEHYEILWSHAENTDTHVVDQLYNEAISSQNLQHKI